MTDTPAAPTGDGPAQRHPVLLEEPLPVTSQAPAAPAWSVADEPPTEEQPPPRPRATRVEEGRVIGGVCAGLAQHLGWSVTVLRVGFVALALGQFVGVVVYAILWLALPRAETVRSPGLEAATRQGMRSSDTPARGRDRGVLIALVAIGAGLVWLSQVTGFGFSSQVFWPLAVACIGLALIWRQADAAPAEDVTGARERAHPLVAPFLARSGWLAITRLLVGLALVAVAFALVLASQIGVGQLPTVLLMVVLAVAGVVVAAAPWLYRSRRALYEAREQRVRADARADMAAHLHDSVLQTLALIQRQSEDPRAVQTLARRQERELRSWLYGDQADEPTLRAALTTAAAEVEDERTVPIEVVMVGDCEMEPDLRALVQAAREAMVNAAKHSGADRIDVFAEAAEDLVEVFVRDRGRGFDLDEVAEDRMGVRGSIIDRMRRHGGTATITSAPGGGTEVRLERRR
ncbi:ATP-binding protein [Auraticoccus monumenti]|uniref:Signal transduction histidine kinase n=1 Tax=Auraticoccus monumenti TaxID=675864 RepID=A0A1G6XNL4_9ACTN|nr:ATP-binding protein [Auraticoccus monumenti]SDD78957.1 Signal transduction histidine kinase [Auraticoccus monumenti]